MLAPVRARVRSKPGPPRKMLEFRPFPIPRTAREMHQGDPLPFSNEPAQIFPRQRPRAGLLPVLKVAARSGRIGRWPANRESSGLPPSRPPGADPGAALPPPQAPSAATRGRDNRSPSRAGPGSSLPPLSQPLGLRQLRARRPTPPPSPGSTGKHPSGPRKRSVPKPCYRSWVRPGTSTG